MIITAVCVILLSVAAASAQELPRGVRDHGIVAPVGRPTWGDSTIATVDRDGSRLVFIKLWTGHDTSYLFIDADTGETDQVRPGVGGWGAYLVFFSPDRNTIYDTMGQWFIEIDVPTREVRRVGEIPSGMALSFAADDRGVIYGGIYPGATVVSYDPGTGEYVNHGPVNEQDWPQYLRPMAVDAHGWVYGGIGQTLAQVVGLNTATGEVVHYVPEQDRVRGQGRVFKGADGEVYANAPGWSWHRLSAGEATAIDEPPVDPAPTAHRTFPDGSGIARVEVADRVMQILEAGADEPREVSFDYESTGVSIYTMIEGPDGNIYGATGVPLRIWRFDPETGDLEDRGLGGHGGHVNQFVRQGDLLYGAIYSSGSLIAYDPAQPYDDTHPVRSENPRHLHGYGAAVDLYGRPRAMLAHPDGRHVLMGGQAARVLAGGGMVIHDTETGEDTVLTPADLVGDQGVNAMAALPDGGVLVGTTTAAATGGRGVATAAMLYRVDLDTKTVTDRWTPEPPAPAIHDMLLAPDGLVYGLTSSNRFFVFDPRDGQVIHDETVEDYGRVTGSQAARCMALGPDGGIYALFRDAIARIEPGTFEHREIVRPGRVITAGITVAGNRLYFASRSRLLSYDLSLVQD